MTYPKLGSLCEGLCRSVYLTDTSKYAVYPWERDEGIAVVVLTRGVQAGGPIYLDHPVEEVQTALDIIGSERQQGRMLAFAGQAPLAAEMAKCDG